MSIDTQQPEHTSISGADPKIPADQLNFGSSFMPVVKIVALSPTVLCAATTRVDGTWIAYVNSVQGLDYNTEHQGVLNVGAKLTESVAREIFSGYGSLRNMKYAS